MKHYAAAGSEAGDHLRNAVVPMANLNQFRPHTLISDGEDSPIIAFPELDYPHVSAISFRAKT
jgi:hypothetical protein